MRYPIYFLLSSCSLLFANETIDITNEDRPPCPSISMIGEINLSYDNFRGAPDGSWNGNTGGVLGVNFGMNILDYVGFQVGGSYGVYDWYGRGPVGDANPTTVQQQEFATAGFFRRASNGKGIQGGALVDWMFNQDFGVFALNPNFGQLRLQLGYLFKNANEIGAWGTIHLNTSHKEIPNSAVSFRAISQVSLFWRHIFDNDAETMLWGGVPYQYSLISPGKLEGQFVIGTDIQAPLNKHIRLDVHAVYIGPAGSSISPHTFNYDANATIGITYLFPIKGISKCSRCTKAKPYLPIGNNSNFLVDTNLND